MYCPNCGNQIPDNAFYCPQCCHPVSPNRLQPSLPMNWFKFLIYFSLFFSAVINFIQSILYFTGSIWATTGDPSITSGILYAYYPGLHALDVVYGFLLLGFSVFLLVTRFRLSGYYKNGPGCLFAVYILSIVLPLLYALLLLPVLSPDAMTFSTFAPTIFSALESAVMLVLNIVYFKKRKHLFRN